MLTILCIATYFKGEALPARVPAPGMHRPAADRRLARRRRLAARRDRRDPHHPARRLRTPTSGAASTRSRCRHRIERIAALDDFDVETGAMLREHLQLPGIGRTVASGFRDKLAMRVAGARDGPARAGVLAGVQRPGAARLHRPRAAAVGAEAAIVRGGHRHQEGREPRRAVARARSGGRRAIERRARAVRAGRRLSRRLDRLERRGRVRRGVQVRPSADGGLAPGRHLHHAPAAGRLGRRRDRCSRPTAGCRTGSAAARRLAHRVHPAPPTARYVFLETSARVGGAFIVDTIEAATGINLWREWAKVDVAGEHGDYAVPPHRRDYAGIVLSLARQEEPDMSAYADPEVVTTIRKHHHAGVIVALAGSAADRSADRRLHAALLPRLLRDRAAAGAPGRVIKRTLQERLVAGTAQPPRRGRLSAGVLQRRRGADIRSSTCTTGRISRIPRPRSPARGSSSATLERLAQRGIEAIVVGVHNAGVDRLVEYSPFPDRRHGGGDADAYLAFLAQSLKPRIDRTFRTRPERDATVIARIVDGRAGQPLRVLPLPVGVRAGGRDEPVDLVRRRGGARLHRGGAHAAGAPVSRCRHARRRSARCGTRAGPDGCWSRRASRAIAARGVRARRSPGPTGARTHEGKPRLRYVEHAGGRHNEADWAYRLEGALEFLLALARRRVRRRLRQRAHCQTQMHLMFGSIVRPLLVKVILYSWSLRIADGHRRARARGSRCQLGDVAFDRVSASGTASRGDGVRAQRGAVGAAPSA